MPRYDDRYGSNTRLYVGHLSARTRSRDLDRLFSRYGRVRDVDMKHDYAFVEFSDPRDADDARYGMNGREFDGSRLIVELSKGLPRSYGSYGGGGGGGGGGGMGGGGGGGGGGFRDFPGSRGPPPGAGRCYNCGIDGHWARDCKAGDWKNRCYRCGDRGHIERNCQNSPKKLRRGKSFSRSPERSPSNRGRNRDRSYSRSRSRSYSRSRSPERHEAERRSISRSYSRSPEVRSASPMQNRSRTPSEEDERSPRKGRGTVSPMSPEQDGRASDYSRSRSRTPSRSRSRSRSRGRSHSRSRSRSRSQGMEERASPTGADDGHNNNSRSATPLNGLPGDGNGGGDDIVEDQPE